MDAAVLAQTAQAPALAGAAEAAPDIAQAAEEAAPAAGTGDVMPVEETPVQERQVQEGPVEEAPIQESPDAEPPAAKAPMEKRVAPADPEPAENPIERGQAIAQANCGRCHAVGDAGESPEPKAPPFRDLHKLSPVESLAESLAEGIVTGHPDMPAFELTAPQVNALISYLKTL
jgi:mono/diheme cytochrome c family protein